ncbi:laccase [Marasmius fiardii PR-910]|nr:laccase [Marasmius fiardii PR-910]
MWAPLVLSLLQLSSAAKGLDVISRVGELHIVNKQISPDGFERSTVLAGASENNPTFPGPIIRGYKGDTFEIEVFDSLTDSSMDTSTSIHWHGIHQHHTNWADGPAWITQCPIVPQESFKYQFTVSDQSGTYWYHSHHRAQYCDGLRGPFIVYDRPDPLAHLYDVDDENTIITLADWYHNTSNFLLATQPGQKFSDSTLINGLGRWANQTTPSPLAVVNVEKGKRYRMRLISLSCDPSYTFSIDGHNMTIIEADGPPTDPVTVNSLQIYAAQRYSFVLDANQPVGNYWIRAQPSSAVPGAIGFEGGINSAILRYKGAPDADPTTKSPSSAVVLRDSDLHFPTQSVPGKPWPGGADVVLNMTIGFIPPGTFSINDVPFHSPTTPVLLQILSGKQAAQDLLPNGSVYTLPRNKVIEINFSSSAVQGTPHPMHLHGHHFDVIKNFGDPTYNFVNPVRRDTVSVGLNDTTSIRFVTDNAGPWFLHCHIDFHLVSGLAVVMAEDTRSVKLDNPVPPDWNNLCPTWDKTPDSIRGSA